MVNIPGYDLNNPQSFESYDSGFNDSFSASSQSQTLSQSPVESIQERISPTFNAPVSKTTAQSLHGRDSWDIEQEFPDIKRGETNLNRETRKRRSVDYNVIKKRRKPALQFLCQTDAKVQDIKSESGVSSRYPHIYSDDEVESIEKEEKEEGPASLLEDSEEDGTNVTTEAACSAPERMQKSWSMNKHSASSSAITGSSQTSTLQYYPEGLGDTDDETQSFPKLYDGIIPIPGFPEFDPEPGDYAAATFDHTGGHLKLPNKGVHLFIPPMAIKEGGTQTVYMYVSDNKKHKPHLSDDGQISLSPTVFCGPHGLSFEEDVLLTLPHYPATYRSEKNMVQCTNTEINEVTKFEEPGDIISIVNKESQSVTIITNHFTGFNIPQPAQIDNDQDENCNDSMQQDIDVDNDGGFMYISIVPYIQRKGDDVAIRLHACPREAIEDVVIEEEQLGGMKADLVRHLRLLKGKDDISATLTLQDGTHEKQTRVMYCDKLFHGIGTSKTFIKHNAGFNQFRCSVNVKQIGQIEEVQFEISEPAVHASTPKTHRSRAAEVNTCMPYFLERDIWLRLEAEDFENVRRTFLSKLLKMEPKEVEAIMRKENPTKTALGIWQTRHGQIEEKEYLLLHDFFFKYQRNDICGILRRYMVDTYKLKLDDIREQIEGERAASGIESPGLSDSGIFSPGDQSITRPPLEKMDVSLSDSAYNTQSTVESD
ncbi:uncharacterized protein LOC144449747 [Glandiceps talaboti]